MGFFDALLAGGVQGFGKGMVDQADYNDRLDAQRAIQEERQRDKFETQRRDQEFKLMLADQKAAGRTGTGSGGGGGMKDFNPVQAFEASYYEYGPDDPRTQRAYELVGTNSRTAQSQLDNVMKRILPQAGGYGDNMPTEADVLASTATDGAEYTPKPPIDPARSKQLAFEGEKALQRLRSAMVDNGKNVDDFAKAETGFRRNDLGDAAVVGTLKKGGSMVDAGDAFNRITSPAPFDQDGSAKTDRTDKTAAATQYKADRDAEKAELNTWERELREVESSIAKAIKPPAGGVREAPADKAERLAELEYQKDRRANLLKSKPTREAPSMPPKAATSSNGKAATSQGSAWRAKMAQAGH